MWPAETPKVRANPVDRPLFPVLMLLCALCVAVCPGVHAQGGPPDSASPPAGPSPPPGGQQAALPVRQTGPEQGGHELQVWTAGGYGVKGVASHTGVWNLGVRYGWVLTAPHGPGFLRGRFEYAVDAVPVFWLFQRGSTAYGAALNPLGLKWNFDTQGRIVPYLELGGGALFTNIQVPPGTSRVNFTSAGALGMHVLGQRFNWSADLRFMHISNAGISSENPGINTVQLRLGVGLFTGGRRSR